MILQKNKLCKHCGQVKVSGEFYPHARGLSAWCRECLKARSREQAINGYFVKNRANKGAKPRVKKEPRIKTGRPPLEGVERIIHTHCWQTLANVRKRCLRNGIACDLTSEWVLEKVTEFVKYNYVTWESRSPFKPSIDRISPKEGYTQRNCRIVWLIENYARNSFTEEELIEFCKRKLGLL